MTKRTMQELRDAGLEAGAASMLISLSDGCITVTHGTDKVTLAKADDVPDGTWHRLWEAMASLGIKSCV